MKRLLIAFALFAAGAGGAAAENFYKWKDAQGVWRYTTTAPPAGVDSSRVMVSGGPKRTLSEAELDADARPGNAPTQAYDQPASGKPGEPPAVDPRTANAIAERRATACDNARKRYDVLGNNVAVEWDRDGDGVAERLDVDAHTAELAKAQQDIGFYCKRS